MVETGRTRDFADWVRPHLPALQRYAARLAPRARDDLLQETLVRAWRRWSTYDESKGAPLPWLLAIMADRSRRRRDRATLPLTAWDGAVEMTTADVDLERALPRLSRRQRQAIDLYYYLDLDVETTARAMGCAPGTVRATLHQARAALRELLGDDDDRTP